MRNPVTRLPVKKSLRKKGQKVYLTMLMTPFGTLPILASGKPQDIALSLTCLNIEQYLKLRLLSGDMRDLVRSPWYAIIPGDSFPQYPK